MDLFELSGGVSTRPISGQPSGCPSIDTPLNEKVQLERFATQELELTTDATVPIDFCGLTKANVVTVKVASGSKVRIDFTSSDGTDQSVPVDSFLALISEAVDITALTVTRLAGGLTTRVKVFLGEKP